MIRGTIHIEIAESFKGLMIRIGDIRGSTELTNFTKKEILYEVSEAIDELITKSKEDEH